MKNYIIYTLFLATFLFGCSSRKDMIANENNEFNKVNSCRSKWVYMDLVQDFKFKVLLFNHVSYHIAKYQAIVIGVTESQDTFAVIDKDFEGKIESGESINLTSFKWSEKEKATLKPLMTVYKEAWKNDLSCSVKTVYYGKIIKSNN